MILNKITVIGLGLIGGSLCSAIKKQGLAGEVTGFDNDPSTREYALNNKIVDRCIENLDQEINADLVVIATYVDSIAETVTKILPHLNKGCIVTDVGSVKAPVVESVEGVINGDVFFIGSHPIAGSENSGIKHSNPDLFKGCNVIVTPTAKSNEESVASIIEFWESIGTTVLKMSPEQHDKIFAYVSHLPHVAAYTLINSVNSSEIEDIFSYSGGGLKDYTRIASSSPDMWKTIFMQNKGPVLESIKKFKDNLELIESAIEENDLNKLREILGKAQECKLS